MGIPDWLLKILGKKIAKKLNLQEGKMDGTKKWYLSKTLYAVVVSGLIGVYLQLIQNGVHLPQIPAWIITLLSAAGFYSRATATDKLTA